MSLLNILSGTKGTAQLTVGGTDVWMDLSDENTLTLSGSSIDLVTDKSGNGKTYGTPGVSPTLSGGGAVFASGTDDYFEYTGSNSDFNYLHDTNGEATIFVAFKSDEATLMGLVRTQDKLAGNTSLGFALDYFNSSNQGNIIYFVANGSAGRGFNTSGAPCPDNTKNNLVFRKQVDSNAYLNFMGWGNSNAFSANTNINYTPSDSDAPNPLTIGKYPNGGGNFVGTIHEIIIYNRSLNLKEIEAVESYLSAKHGTSFTARDRSNLVVLNGQSNAEGRGVIANSTDFNSGDVITGSKIYQYSTANTYNDLELGDNNQDGLPVGSLTQMGMEAGLMDEMNSLNSDTNYLLKYGVGGSDIETWLQSGTYGPTLKQRMYRAIQELEDINEVPVLYFLHVQGESDAGVEADAANYFDNNFDFWTEVESSSLGYSFLRKAIYYVDGNPDYSYQDTVNNAKSRYANARQETLLLTRPVTHKAGDADHATADNLTEFGRDAAAWFINEEKRYDEGTGFDSGFGNGFI